MFMKFKILGSSSSGNCALLQTERSRILIDAGFSARRLMGMLKECNLTLEDIDAVFITHEHGDHTAGLRGMARLHHLKFFANRHTAQAIQSVLKKQLKWQLFETGSSFKFFDIEVTTFSVPHDAHDPVGFIFTCGGQDLFHPKRSLAWVTDLGYIPTLVSERVKQVDALVIEANHDLKLLESDRKRPWSIKQRIRGRHGHLSNDSTYEFITSTQNQRWQKIWLAHLSKDCNNCELVSELFKKPANDIDIEVINPENGSPDTIDLFKL